jgi:PAS domain S-box-containing protein
MKSRSAQGRGQQANRQTRSIGAATDQSLPIRSEVLGLVSQAAATALTSGDFTKAGEIILQCALSQTESEVALFGALENGSVIRIVAQNGLDSKTSATGKVDLKRSKIDSFDALIASGKTVLCNAPANDSNCGQRRLNSFLCVPFRSGSKVFGVLIVANRNDAYGVQEQHIVEILAPFAGAICDASRQRERTNALEQSCRAAEEALAQSETRFRLVAQSTQDVVWDWNLATDQLLPSGLFQPFGYTSEQDGKTAEFWFERIHREDLKKVTSSLQAACAGTDTTWSAEYRFRRRDDSYAEVFDCGNIIRDSTGHAVRMVGVMSDITARHRLEEARRQSDEQFRLMVEKVNDYAIFILDPSGKIVNWNSGAEKLTGYLSNEIVGRDFSCFHPKSEVQQGRPQQLLQTVASEGHFAEEGWRVRKDRTQFWAETNITAVFEDQKSSSSPSPHWGEGRGEVLCGFAVVLRDITERKYSEEVLRASEERTRLIIDSAHDAFVSMDPHTFTTDWNCQAEKIFGWKKAEAIGWPLTKFVVLPPWLRVDKGWTPNSPLPRNARFETRALHRDGHSFPVEVSMTLIRLGEEYVFSAFLHDITERKRAEALLRQLPCEILRAQELERKRVARELHDSVGQSLTLAKIRIQSVEQMLPEAESAHEQTVKVRNLLGDCIEELRRIAHNLMPSELEDLGLIAAVRNLCAEFSSGGGIKVKLKYSGIPDKLPADLNLPLFRIIQEALSNIAKHSGATHVEVQLFRTSTGLTITIRDNGKGFEPSGSTAKSIGMGMANMKQRAATIGGTLNIDSIPRLGTTVMVEVSTAEPLAAKGPL